MYVDKETKIYHKLLSFTNIVPVYHFLFDHAANWTRITTFGLQ